MFGYIKTLLAKWIGGKWIFSAGTTVVAFIIGWMQALPVQPLSPEEVVQFQGLLVKALTGYGAYFLPLLLAFDFKVFKKPDMPVVPKE